MARVSGCLCRVPVQDLAPGFTYSAELMKWAADHRVDLEMDHMNRLSMSMEDAYRLRAEQNAQSEKAAEEAAAKAAKLQQQIQQAHERRQSVYAAAYTKAVSQGLHPSRAMDDGRKAVEHAERNLDPVIRAQVPTSIEIPQVQPPGLGQVTAQYGSDELGAA